MVDGIMSLMLSSRLCKFKGVVNLLELGHKFALCWFLLCRVSCWLVWFKSIEEIVTIKVDIQLLGIEHLWFVIARLLSQEQAC